MRRVSNEQHGAYADQQKAEQEHGISCPEDVDVDLGGEY